MIRPLISNEAFSLRSYGGIINYFLRLIPALEALGAAPTVVAPLHRVDELRSSSALASPAVRVPDSWSRGNRLLNAAAYGADRLTAARHRGDDLVVHRSYYYRSAGPALPTVLTVHDTIAEYFADGPSAVVEARRRAVADADHLLVDSETTRRDVLEVFGVAPERVTVALLASGLPLVDRGAPTRRLDDLVLYVGNRAGYKNFATLVEAMASPELSGARLVAYGGGPLSDDEHTMIASLGLADRIAHQAPGDDALDLLYREASVFVMPSRYEGFGLPVLEAMERGCPVVVADAGSLPEVAGDAALRFDATDAAELADQLARVLGEPALADDLGCRGLRRADDFSWAQTAEATMSAYRRALGEHR